ncbi:MAG: hypothetical protein JXM70_07975 [Pirellulales bacterium]|nr:hypothetical protein [Pirellulales bacterium]
MPRVFKKAKQRIHDWGDSHREVLETGGAVIGMPIEFTGPDANENLLRAWLALREKMEAEWSKLGKRPWGWWTFESNEPRDRNRDEAEQLESLGELTPEELAALKAAAVREDEALHNGNYQFMPFRRSWGFWRFCHKRRPEISEAEQLCKMCILTPLEKKIKLDPVGFLAGRVCCFRSRIGYLSDDEMDLLKLWPPKLKVKPCDP